MITLTPEEVDAIQANRMIAEYDAVDWTITLAELPHDTWLATVGNGDIAVQRVANSRVAAINNATIKLLDTLHKMHTAETSVAS